MKKVFLFVMISVFAMQLNAQGVNKTVENTPGKFYVMPKVGYNLANISKLHGDPRSGLNAGISGEYIITPQIAIEGGVYYSMQGTTFKVSGVKMQLNNDYINVPILLKGYVAEGFHIFAGPQFGYLVNSKIKIKTGSSFLDDILNIVGNSFDFSKYENKFDFAVVVGMGYQFDMGLAISANYNIGMIKVPDAPTVKIKDYEFDLNPDARNNTLQINLGYKF